MASWLRGWPISPTANHLAIYASKSALHVAPQLSTVHDPPCPRRRLSSPSLDPRHHRAPSHLHNAFHAFPIPLLRHRRGAPSHPPPPLLPGDLLPLKIPSHHLIHLCLPIPLTRTPSSLAPNKVPRPLLPPNPNARLRPGLSLARLRHRPLPTRLRRSRTRVGGCRGRPPLSFATSGAGAPGRRR